MHPSTQQLVHPSITDSLFSKPLPYKAWSRVNSSSKIHQIMYCLFPQPSPVCRSRTALMVGEQPGHSNRNSLTLMLFCFCPTAVQNPVDINVADGGGLHVVQDCCDAVEPPHQEANPPGLLALLPCSSPHGRQVGLSQPPSPPLAFLQPCSA